MPLLILASLVVVYIILGVLYESLIHPLTILSTLPSAGLGALLALQIAGLDFGLVAMIGVILLIGIVKKNGIMLVDFAIEAERKESLSSEEAIMKAAQMRFPTYSDDDNGGPPRRRAPGNRTWCRFGITPAAGLRHRWWFDRQPDPDSLHDTGHLSASRQAAEQKGRERSTGICPIEAQAGAF